MNQLLHRHRNKVSVWESVTQLPESHKGLEQCVDLLLQLQTEKGPVIETLNVIRQDKPIMYSWLRKRLDYRPGLKMLLDIRHDYELARRVIGYEG
ncbi:hypothetical protein [Gorillibacterium sp. sgz5001074]|uniref:hypothetical protein n=1 Tax=Gorillibacterium sp. sgz5001074 TaxID=3446695 RepID=UPI003F67C8C0